jgi:hypothetical protein
MSPISPPPQSRLGPLDELQHARLERVGAEIVFNRGRGRDAPPLLLEASRRLEHLDAAMARETYLEALASAIFAGRLATGPNEREVAAAARGSNPVPSRGPAEGLLAGLVIRFTEGYAASVAPLSEAVRAFDGPDAGGADRHWLWLACRLAQDLWDDELWYALATRGVSLARETGALNRLAVMANFLAVFHIHAGAFATAAALIEEVDAITQATGIPPLKYAEGLLIAARGDLVSSQGFFEWGLENLIARGEGSGLGIHGWLRALMCNANGRYAQALAQAQRGCEYEDVLAYGRNLAELIEAAVRVGRSDEAAVALDRLSQQTRASGTEWALGVEARGRALVGDDEVRYRESIGGHSRRADAAGDPGRAAGAGRAHQPGDRCPAVHQSADGRVPPAQGVPQARCEHAQGTSRRRGLHRWLD